jgi:hypothetical protein
MNTYKITKENKKEEEIVSQILVNNEYPPQTVEKGKQRSSAIEPLITRNHK